MPVHVLRLGHRIFRDKRITTHLFLTSRAFGAQKGYYTGEKDAKLEETILKTSKAWGGEFAIEHIQNPRSFVSNYGGEIAHLTVYGLPADKMIAEIRKHKKLLVIVGGEKVPYDFYKMADWNIAIGAQPHSEVSSLAIFLDRYFAGMQFSKKFNNARLKIIGQERGKKVLRL